MEYLVKYSVRIILTIFGLWLICFFISKSQETHYEKPNGSYWKNIDPNRPVTDVESYDYVNRTVTYYDYTKKPEQKGLFSGKSSSDGIVFKSGNVTIQTDLSAEDILEQMDIDYNDIADYLGDELR